MKHLIPALSLLFLISEWCTLNLRHFRPKNRLIAKGFRAITCVTESQILALMAALHERPDYGPNIIQNLRGALTFDCSTPLMSTRSHRVQSEIGSCHNLHFIKSPLTPAN